MKWAKQSARRRRWWWWGCGEVLEGGGGERMSLRLTSASSGLWSEVRRVLGLGYLPESLLPVTLHPIRTAPTAREGKYTFFQKRKKTITHAWNSTPPDHQEAMKHPSGLTEAPSPPRKCVENLKRCWDGKCEVTRA